MKCKKSPHRLLFFSTLLSFSAAMLVRTPLLAVENARQADAFVDSIGVNIHLGYTDVADGNYDGFVKPKLLSLGVRHVRDGFSAANAAIIPHFQDLAAQNPSIKANLLLPPSIISAVLPQLPGAIASIEGPNETDNPGKVFSYNSKVFPGSTQDYQADLYQNVKSVNPDLPVYAPSFMTGGGPVSVGVVPCDAGVLHSYPGGGLPDAGIDSNCSWLPLVAGNTRPIVTTETGYFTFNEGAASNQGVSERAQGKYIPRQALEYFRRGIARMYLYELFDTWSATNTAFNNTNKESHFGLIAVSGPGSGLTGNVPVLREKPAFTALKNLIAILQDPGNAFQPASLGYTLSGSNQNALRHILLQKRDGSFWLVLWQNVLSFNLTSYTDLYPADQTVNITFDHPVAGVTFYQPSQGTSPVTNPAIPSGSLSTITGLAVPDEAVILKITGASATADTTFSAGVAAFGAGEGLLTSDSSVSYYNNFINATIFSSDYADEKIGSYIPSSIRSYRAVVKFDLPPLPAGQIVQDVSFQIYLRSKTGSPVPAVLLVSYATGDNAVRITDWNDSTGLQIIGNVITPSSTAEAITISSANYPLLGFSVRDAYVHGANHIAFRFQLDGSVFAAGSNSLGDYYDIGSSKINTPAQRPKLTLTLGAPSTVNITLAAVPAQDGYLRASAPYAAAISAGNTDPSARVGDSNLNDAYQAYYKFPLSSIPAGVQITGVRFGFYNRAKTGAPTNGILLETYEPSSGPVSLLDWTDQTQVLPIGDILSPADNSGSWTVESTTLTEALAAAHSRFSPYLGFRLKLSDGACTTGVSGAFDYYSLGTSENASASQQPYLEVDYR